MQTYAFSLTKEQLFDCAKQYRSKAIKPSILMAVITLVMFGLLFGLSYVEGFDYLRFGSFFFIFLGFFLVLIVIFSQRGVKSQNELFFKSCQVEGLVSYEFQLCETEFVVLQPQKGNVHHYLYEYIVRVVDLTGYTAVVLAGNQFLPILVNEHTEPLISALKSHCKTTK